MSRLTAFWGLLIGEAPLWYTRGNVTGPRRWDAVLLRRPCGRLGSGTSGRHWRNSLQIETAGTGGSRVLSRRLTDPTEVVGGTPIEQHAVELILLRQWSSYMPLPVFIIEAAGELIYYNEAAELLLGRRFDEAGEMPLAQLASMFQTRDEDGAPLPTEALPIAIALNERRPAHRRFQYWGLDGTWHLIDVTGLPLTGQGGKHLGAVAIFWEVESG